MAVVPAAAIYLTFAFVQNCSSDSWLRLSRPIQCQAGVPKVLHSCPTGLGGLIAIHLSLICMTVRLGWTDCHTFLSYLYESKAWLD